MFPMPPLANPCRHWPTTRLADRLVDLPEQLGPVVVGSVAWPAPGSPYAANRLHHATGVIPGARVEVDLARSDQSGRSRTLAGRAAVPRLAVAVAVQHFRL